MSERRVVVVGSTTFPITPELGAEVVDILRGYPEGTVFLTRTTPGFDRFVSKATEILGYPCVVYASAGGAHNWLRDVALAKDGDELLAFLDPDTISRADTGTAHVVEKMLDKKKPVQSWTVAHGKLVFAGSMP